MSLDLEHHLTFYGAYHHNTVNKIIHIICVPVILISAFCMATYTGPLIETPSWATVPYLDLNLGTVAALLYTALYLLLEPVAGFALSAFCLAGTAYSNYLKTQNSTTTFQIALGLHVVAWIAQFVGHGAFERRAPALLDNLVQAVFLAPLFVWLEVLFQLGYRPALQARIEKKIQQEIAKFRSGSKNGKAQ
ncbi:hypothetical protein E4U43_000206 [Claviceps pusilla]|uniref:DUF962 domain protein n=1 Tax=Claviceps pusilla TaxID=123648 RepID=A0A9P7NCB1_9HYPO|nr:hypothetical protein E4U43_000206 [Claviceps pusilla]